MENTKTFASQQQLFSQQKENASRPLTRTLFDVPRCRRSDPVTSYLAAEKLRLSGRLRGQRRAVYEALRKNDGATSAEISSILGHDRYLASRRMCELERRGLIVRGKPRVCRVTGNKCLTWWINDGRGTSSQGNL